MEMEKEGRSGQTEGQRTDGRVQDGANVLVWGAEGRRGAGGEASTGSEGLRQVSPAQGEFTAVTLNLV